MGRPGSLARRVNRGETWLYTFRPPDKRRPVLVLSRPDVITLLSTVMVAPITSTIRDAPSEVVVGIDEGLKRDSAVNLDHVQTVPQEALRHYIGSLSREKMTAIGGRARAGPRTTGVGSCPGRSAAGSDCAVSNSLDRKSARLCFPPGTRYRLEKGAGI